MTERELEILEILKNDPLISQESLAQKLVITRSGVAAHIHNLMKKGYIKGKGYILNDIKFVTVIGGNNIDILGIPKEKLIVQNSNPGKISYTYGGAGHNIAYALTKYDASNYFISVYGNDINGERFINHCREHKIDIQCCEKIHGAHTSSFMYIDDFNGVKFVGINDMDIYQKMTPEFLSKYLDRINASQYCVADTNIPAQSFQYLYTHVTVPFLVKTTSIQKNDRMIQENQKIFALITNPLELKELLGYYKEPYTDVEHAVCFLQTKNIANIVVFSLNEGLYFHGKTQEIRLKKKLPGTVNTAGATAVLTSTIVWGLQNSLSWKRILRYGYAAISITLQSRQPVNPQLCVSAVLEQEKLLFDT